MRKIFFAFSAIVTLCLASPIPSWAVDGVAYIDMNGAAKTANGVRELSSNQTTLNAGWYRVRNTVSFSSRITVNGNVNIILTDGSHLNASNGGDAGIRVTRTGSLTIYAQSVDATKMGKLTAEGFYNAGIGGDMYETSGAITINGGAITAASSWGAGIGGGDSGAGGNIAINNGILSATSTTGTAIGGNIHSGGGAITINGGLVKASSNHGAGIGGGNGWSDTDASGTVSINGGAVTALSEYGVGIGGIGDDGGVSAQGGSVTFSMNSDGMVSASSVGDDTPKEKGILFGGNNGTIYGNIILVADLTIPGDKTLTIPSGATLSVPEGRTLRNEGNIENHGEIRVIDGGELANNGAISGSGAVTHQFTPAPTEVVEESTPEEVPEAAPPAVTNVAAATPTEPNKPAGNVVVNRSASPTPPASGIKDLANNQTTLNTGWYRVNDTITFSSRIIVNGDVHLILSDGSHLNAQLGIQVTEPNSLTIHSQSTDADRMGKLTATSVFDAGIGGLAAGKPGGNITINGGTISASSVGGAGIGGGTGGAGGTTTINGGTVSTTSDQGTGIGGGYGSTGGIIIVNDGTVSAASIQGAGMGGGYGLDRGGTGGTIMILGGTVSATSNKGAGIGGGGKDGDGGDITIEGGTIKATSYGGAGIGGGGGGDGFIGGAGGTITITGGAVEATSNKGAGIGGGDGRLHSGAGGTITIDNSTVVATSTWGAGIGGGYDTEGAIGSITINSGVVKATTTEGAGISGRSTASANGTGGSITIFGGTVEATSRGSMGTGITGAFGMDGNGAVVIATSVDDTSGKTNGILFAGDRGTAYGNVTLLENLTIPIGKALVISRDTTLTVPDGKILTNDGRIDNSGEILVIDSGKLANNGTVTGNRTVTHHYTTTSQTSADPIDSAASSGSSSNIPLYAGVALAVVASFVLAWLFARARYKHSGTTGKH